MLLGVVGLASRGQSVSSACPDQAPTAFLNWAKQTAVPLAPSGSTNDFRDLRFLRKAIGGARVVGLGEAARRVQEFHELRTRLLKFLVEEMGFTGIAVETGFAEAIKANDYVLGRIAEPANWQDWFTLGFGDELETQAMLRWMRQYNQDSRHLRKIHFYGVDVMPSYSSPETALNIVFAYLDRVDRSFASSPTRLDLQALVQKFLGSGRAPANMQKSLRAYATLPSEDRNAYTASIADLLARFEGRRADYIARSNDEAYELARHAAVAARQLDTTYRADVAGAPPGQQVTAVDFALIWGVREAAMFENLTWALRQEGPSGRLMLWAHDAHLAKGTVPSTRGDLVGLLERGRFGLLIEKALGESYFTIGTAFYEGKPGWQNAVQGAACGTVGGELARISASAFSLDIRPSKKDTASLAWLDKPRTMPADTSAAEYRVVPSRAWDAMVFIRHITPVRVSSN